MTRTKHTPTPRADPSPDEATTPPPGVYRLIFEASGTVGQGSALTPPATEEDETP